MAVSDRMMNALTWYNAAKQRVAGRTHGAVYVAGDKQAGEVDMRLLQQINPDLAVPEMVAAFRTLEVVAKGVAKEFDLDEQVARNFIVEGAYAMLCYISGKTITREEAEAQERLLSEETLH